MTYHQEERKEVPISRKNPSLCGADNSHREGLVCPSPQMVELQKALEEFVVKRVYWNTIEDADEWYEKVMQSFSAFQKDYDSQLHVPRFSICMSAEDYDRMVHISRKRLEDKVAETKNVIDLGKAEGFDFAYLKGALSVWEELLPASEGATKK